MSQIDLHPSRCLERVPRSQRLFWNSLGKSSYGCSNCRFPDSRSRTVYSSPYRRNRSNSKG